MPVSLEARVQVLNTSDFSKYTLTSKAAELKKQNTGGSSDTIIVSTI